jgi:hypothetical protein
MLTDAIVDEVIGIEKNENLSNALNLIVNVIMLKKESLIFERLSFYSDSQNLARALKEISMTGGVASNIAF